MINVHPPLPNSIYQSVNHLLSPPSPFTPPPPPPPPSFGLLPIISRHNVMFLSQTQSVVTRPSESVRSCGTEEWSRPSSVVGWEPMSSLTVSWNQMCEFVFYPTLGCDIQVFRAMGLSVQYWQQWFQDFPAFWLAVPFGANGAHLGICTLSGKSSLCVNKLFLAEIKFSQRKTRPVKSFWWQIVHMQESTNDWKNLKKKWNNGTCGNTIVKSQTVRYRLIKYASKFWKYCRIRKMSLDSILNCFIRY